MARWIWAIGLATAASQTSNPLLLALIFGVLGLVVTARRTQAPWARAFKYYLIMALIGGPVSLQATLSGGHRRHAAGMPVVLHRASAGFPPA